MENQISKLLTTLNSKNYYYLAIIILFIAIFSIFQWVNAQPSFCNTCHEMNFNYNTWSTSTHANSASCLNCHSEPGISGFIDEKIRGAIELIEHIFGNYHMPIKATVRVKDAQCLSCHPETFNIQDKTVDARHDIHIQIGVQCVNCHDRVVHSAPGEPNVIQLNQCENCHNRHGSFPLIGSHSNLTCSQCHKGSVYTNMNSTCHNCHKASSNHIFGISTNCDACHTLEGWEPAIYDHSGFPLNGKHNGTKCNECHQGGKFLGTSNQCASCHTIPIEHFKTTDSCDSCHIPDGWEPADFDHLFYPLKDKHKSVECVNCHPGSKYSGTSKICEACHEIPTIHAVGDVGNCDVCHTTQGWKPATFDHSGFNLTGAHSLLTCDRCHISGVYTDLSTFCDSCHKAPTNHQGLSLNCITCHSVEGWMPLIFNHTVFELTGAHASLQCVQCHTNGVYTGLSKACASCHQTPPTHAGLSLNCASCHTTSFFTPSIYRHLQIAEHYPSGDERLNCQSCHKPLYSIATCTGSRCHSTNNPRDD